MIKQIIGISGFKTRLSRLTLLKRLNIGSNKEITEINSALSSVSDPVIGKPITSIGLIHAINIEKGANVSIDLDLFVPGYPFRNEILDKCNEAVRKLSWVKECRVNVIAAKKFGSSSSMEKSNLSQIGHVVAVSSCKGGVGKSTVAVNLACAMASKGLKVGILDGDIYGPSLPIMLKAKDLRVFKSETNPKHVLPLESDHDFVISSSSNSNDSSVKKKNPIKMFSFGHVNPNSGAPGSGGKKAAVVRGPIVSKIITQLILGTEWGDIDYLIVDMPPGTGDIQITLTQNLSFTGAVIVTTPHSLSLVDAAKGVTMFEELKVPTLSIVENMAYFQGDDDKIYYPFGQGGRKRLLQGLSALQPQQQQLDNSNSNVSSSNNNSNNSTYNRLKECPIHSIPLVPEVETNNNNDSTSNSPLYTPIVIQDPTSPSSQEYSKLADSVISEIFKTQLEAIIIPSVSYNHPKRKLILRYFSSSSAEEYFLPIHELRKRDPKTGKLVISSNNNNNSNSSNDQQQLYIDKLDYKGNYGIAFIWSDGYYQDIFSYDVLKSIASEFSGNDSNSKSIR